MRAPLIMSSALLTLAKIAAAQTPGFWPTGLAPGMNQGKVTGLSADGGAAVGWEINASATSAPGFSWTRQGGRVDFGLLPGMPSSTPANGVSGPIIVGTMNATSLTSARAYRWTGSGPLQDLGVLPSPETRSYGYGVSGDGSVVVGGCEYTSSTSAYGQAFRWTAQTGMVGLGYAQTGGSFSRAVGVSRDGGTIVGYSQSFGPTEPYVGFRWTQATGMQALPFLPGGTVPYSQANAVSANGQVIVGNAVSPQTQNTTAVLWLNGAPQDLGSLPGFVSSALAVNDAGDVVGGHVYTGITSFAFVWTPSTGMQLLSDRLAAAGVSVPSNYRLESIFAESGDGLTFGDQALNLTTGVREGFVATIPPPASILILALPALVRRKRPAA